MSEPQVPPTLSAGPEQEPRPGPETGTPADGPAAPEPLGVALAETGNAEVDALLERLADADALPTESHIEVYEDVHRGLRDTLTALDSRPGPPGPAPSSTYDRR